MRDWQRNAMLTAALLAFGAARLPFESALSTDLRERGLTPPPVEVGVRDKIGQTSSAVVLGGLRTLVATFMNLRAFGFFEEQKWDNVAETYDTIVDLAPRSSFYWDNGAWHMHTNAASFYLNDDENSPLRRRQAWKDSILRGRAFLERGIRNNPNDGSLYKALGDLLSSEFRYHAFGNADKSFAEAAEAYQKAVATGNALGHVKRAEFFALARVPGKEKEALELGHQLYENPRNRVPTLKALLFVLEAHQNPGMDTVKRAIEIYGTAEDAYMGLSGLWRWTSQRYPVYGVAPTLEALEKMLAVPAGKSVFNQPLRAPKGPDDWFSK